MTIQKAEKLLLQCESELRALVASSAEKGDYEAVIRITSWAKQVAALTGPKLPAVQKQGDSRPAQRSTPRPTYPFFVRRADYLVKVGWSKSTNGEYEHKVARHIALSLSAEISRAGSKGKVFQIDSFLPASDPSDGTEVPTYQVYLVVAWLRYIGLIDQHGRQGYSLPNPSQLQKATESAWLTLEEKEAS